MRNVVVRRYPARRSNRVSACRSGCARIRREGNAANDRIGITSIKSAGGGICKRWIRRTINLRFIIGCYCERRRRYVRGIVGRYRLDYRVPPCLRSGKDQSGYIHGLAVADVLILKVALLAAYIKRHNIRIRYARKFPIVGIDNRIRKAIVYFVLSCDTENCEADRPEYPARSSLCIVIITGINVPCDCDIIAGIVTGDI